MCIHICLNLPPRSHIDPFHFGKKSDFQLATEKSTALGIPFSVTEMELHQDIFIKLFSLRLADTAQIHLANDIGIPPQKTNTGRNYSPK